MTTSEDLLRSLRQRLKDLGGSREVEDAWLSDDSTCLWKNAELYSHLSEAQREFCTRRPIHDALTLTLVAEVPEYALPDTTYTVEEVRLVSTSVDLLPFNHHAEAALRDCTYDEPTWYAIDLREQALRVYPTPLVADTLAVRVTRLPETGISDFEEPEIQEQHRRYLIDWAAFLAYQKPGADTLDYDQAAHFRSRFDAAVGPQIPVNHQEIRRVVANRRLRTTAYYR